MEHNFLLSYKGKYHTPPLAGSSKSVKQSMTSKEINWVGILNAFFKGNVRIVIQWNNKLKNLGVVI